MIQADASSTFVGVPTFLDAPLVRPEDVPVGAVAISGAPHDSTSSGRPGGRLGPKAVRMASLQEAESLVSAGASGLVNPDTGQRRFLPAQGRLVDVGDFTVYPTDVLKTTESIAQGVYQITKRGGISVCLGGDHYIEYPSCLGYCRAMAEQKPGVRIGYVHLDAHLDFTDTHPHWGKYSNGTNARRTAEIDEISVSNMVWLGVEVWAGEEPMQAIRRNGGVVYTYEDLRTLGAGEATRRAADHAMDGCDSIYLSVDVDIVDSGFFPGCAGVVFGAVTPTQLIEMMEVLKDYPIGAMDINEQSPRLDPSGRSMSFAVEAILTLCHDKLFG